MWKSEASFWEFVLSLPRCGSIILNSCPRVCWQMPLPAKQYSFSLVGSLTSQVGPGLVMKLRMASDFSYFHQLNSEIIGVFNDSQFILRENEPGALCILQLFYQLDTPPGPNSLFLMTLCKGRVLLIFKES